MKRFAQKNIAASIDITYSHIYSSPIAASEPHDKSPDQGIEAVGVEMIENHMVIERASDRAREAAAEQAERAFKQEYQDAAAEIEGIIINDAAKVSPKHLTVPYVDGAGFLREYSVADLFVDQISSPGIDELFYRLMQTEAAKELRMAIAKKYVEHNADEIAEVRSL